MYIYAPALEAAAPTVLMVRLRARSRLSYRHYAPQIWGRVSIVGNLHASCKYNTNDSIKMRLNRVSSRESRRNEEDRNVEKENGQGDG
jgi:hypothetical protein